MKKHSIIHKGISNNVQDIACRMFAQHLIPERVYGSVTGALDRLTACERTDLLLSELESRISVQPAALMQFLDVLKESDACYIPLVRTISEFLILSVLSMYVLALAGLKPEEYANHSFRRSVRRLWLQSAVYPLIFFARWKTQAYLL